MRETKKIQEEIELSNNLIEVSSISMDTNYEFTDRGVSGYFIVNGTAKTHALSTLKDEFEKKIPFNHEFSNEVINGEIEVDDFTYDIDANRILLDIEYKVLCDEVISDEVDIEKLIDDENVEVCDLRDDLLEDVEKVYDELKPERNINMEDDTIKDYVMYHVHTCIEDDTLDTISNKYNVSIEKIKEYNEITEIKKDMKLIIPSYNE